eukprot:symbB.v1.2.025759.t1/scaffold2518.1/size77081/3
MALERREGGGKPPRPRPSTSKPNTEDFDEFDAESFTVVDTERAQRVEDPAVLALLQSAWAQEVEYFPEVIRAGLAGKIAVGEDCAETWSPQAIGPADLGAGSSFATFASGNSQRNAADAVTETDTAKRTQKESMPQTEAPHSQAMDQ